MSRVKLDVLIKTLKEIKADYKKSHKQDPYIWDMDSFGGEINEIRISPKPRDTVNGLSVKSNLLKTYVISDGFLLEVVDEH